MISNFEVESDMYKEVVNQFDQVADLVDLDSNIQIVDIRDDSERKLVSLRNTINIKSKPTFIAVEPL